MVPSPALGETSGMPQPEKAFQKNAQMSQAQELTAGQRELLLASCQCPFTKLQLQVSLVLLLFHDHCSYRVLVCTSPWSSVLNPSCGAQLADLPAQWTRQWSPQQGDSAQASLSGKSVSASIKERHSSPGVGCSLSCTETQRNDIVTHAEK